MGFNDVICKYGSYKYAMNDWPSPTCCQVNQAPTTPEIVSCPHPPWNLIKTHHTFWYGYGSIPINTIFSGMNIHLPAILMFTRGTRFWPIPICLNPNHQASKSITLSPLRSIAEKSVRHIGWARGQQKKWVTRGRILHLKEKKIQKTRVGKLWKKYPEESRNAI